MKANQLFFNNIIICLFLTSIHAIQSYDIFAQNSYSAKNLICSTFTIYNTCTIEDTVQAKSGTVYNSMSALEIYIKFMLKVYDSLTTNTLQCKHFEVYNNCIIEDTVEAESGTVYNSMSALEIYIKFKLKVYDSLTTNTLQCKHFEVYNNCIIEHTVKAESGTVYNSMSALEIYIKFMLKVYNSLTTNKLQCKHFEVHNNCIIEDTVEAESGKVSDSMTIKKGGNIKNLIVGGSLHCVNINVSQNARIGSVVYAQQSVFNTVDLQDKNTCLSTAYLPISYIISFFYFFYKKALFIFWYTSRECDKDDFLLEEEISNFEDCTINALKVDRKNDKKQVIKLTNTTVKGDIIFAKDTIGEVQLYGTAQLHGNIINGICNDMRNNTHIIL